MKYMFYNLGPGFERMTSLLQFIDVDVSLLIQLATICAYRTSNFVLYMYIDFMPML